MSMIQKWYQNPDFTISYVFVCSVTDNVLGFGGEVQEGAVLLESEETLQSAHDDLEEEKASNMAICVAQQEEIQAERDAALAANLAAAETAHGKLVEFGVYTSAEASVITGYYPVVDP